MMSDRDIEQELLPQQQQSQQHSKISSVKKLALGLLLGGGVAATIGILAKQAAASSQSNVLSNTSNSSAYPPEIAERIRSIMNASADPCEDFYEYACGGWLARTQIPADRGSVEISFSTIEDRNLEVLQTVSAENWPVIGTMYQNCMNTDEIEKAGVQPFKDSIGKILDADQDVWKHVGDLFAKQVSVFLGIGTVVDSKIPTEYAVNFGQSGLTLPQKVFYDNADAVAKLKSYLLEMLRLYENVPAENVQARVDAVVGFEKQLAAIWIPLNDLRDPVATYNKYSYDSLKSAFPGIQWDALLPAFLAQDITSKVSFLIDSPKYLQDLQGLISKTGKDVIVDYMKLRAITSYASYLPSQFVNNRFDFFGKYLSGIQEMPSQSKKCSQILDSNLGDILGRYYVERAFPGESKTVSETMITYIRNAFGKNLPKVSWMDDQTKKAALTKLSQITDLIGYPDNWTDYSDIYIKPHQFFDNVLETNQFATQKSLSNLGKPVRKDLWQMTPPTVNAYYDPTLNTINFPAGILQPSFFNISYPMAMNFGGIGMVAGHELSHGFDDQGRQFDGTGKLTTWWTDYSVANFKTQAQCYIDQYNQFTVYDLHVHGDQTLGENIADNSGIKTSFYAYQDWKAKNGEEARVLPELTNEQLFFLAYGQGWCAKSSEANAKQRVETDVHSPPQYRILGPLQNSYEFAQAFKCAKNTRMNPDKKCQLW